MEILQPPKPLQITSGEISENHKAWVKWKENFEMYMLASGADVKEDKIKKALLLYSIGEEGRRIKKTMQDIVEEGQNQTTYNQLMTKFDEHFVEKTNVTFERHLFRNLKQGGKKFSEFITELREQAAKCNFEGTKDEHLRDQIIFGIDSMQLRRKIFDLPNRDSLSDVIEACRKWEMLTQQLKDMQGKSVSENTGQSTETSAHAVNSARRGGAVPKRGRSTSSRGRGKSNPRYNKSSTTTNSEGHGQSRPRCYRCNTYHDKGQCRAWGKRCNKCNGMGHFEVCCTSKKVFNVSSQEIDKNVHVNFPDMSDMSASLEESYDHDDQYFVSDVSSDKMSKCEWFVNCCVGDEMKNVKFKLDTGSMVNILPMNVYKTVTQKPVKTCHRRLTAYNNQPIKVVGELLLHVKPKPEQNKVYDLKFIVVDQMSTPIIGVEDCERLGLVQKTCSISEGESLVKQYADVFSPKLVGLKSPPVHIKLKEGAEGEQVPSRRVPFALLNKVKTELEHMQKEGIISKVENSTKFVSPLVIVEKPSGELRICLDPQALNKSVICDKYVIPTVEELTAKLAGSKFFATLDAKAGFWQVKLDDESAELTTFSTPFGNFKFHRLPFGLNVSTQIFSRIVAGFFENIPGVELYVDDILVHAPDEITLQKRLKAVFDICREKNLRLNKNKCIFKQSEIKYLGFLISAQGIKVDPDKVNSIVNFETPQNKDNLHQFLGMLTYVGKFIPNLSEETNCLRELLKKDVPFIWTPNHEEAFQRLKGMLVVAPVLKFFDPKKDIVVSCDASKNGLGACLLQDNHPVAFVSRTLTKSEVNYAQIEKELLSVAFSCNRFHQYLYGRRFYIENDHKPLKFILSKPLASCPPRIQRLMLRLQEYNFEYIWKPGKELLIADALSRNPESRLTEDDVRLEKEIQCQVHMITTSLPFSDAYVTKFKNSVQNDTLLQSLKCQILDGWPENVNMVNDKLKPFWNFREELTFQDDLLYKGERILIPKEYQAEMLTRLHEGHLGIEKCIARAKNSMFWIGITNDVKKLVSECDVCQTYQPGQQKEPLITHERPDIPWYKLGTDVFHFDGNNYLLVVDYYSNYFEIAQLRNMSSKETILKFKSILSRHGIPRYLVSDNATNYVNDEFRQFAESWGIEHTTSSPRYPKANGLAEKYVGIVKKLLVKSQSENLDPYLALLNYRDTPVLGDKSSAQLLMGRHLRTRIPVQSKLLKPQKQVKVQADRRNKCFQQQKVYNRSARPLPPLVMNENVTMWSEQQKKWLPAKVVGIKNNPRSYVVETSRGDRYTRNRVQLRKTKADFQNVQAEPILSPEYFDWHFGTQTTDTNDLENVQNNNDSQSTIARRDPNVQSSPNRSNVTTRGRQIRMPARFKDYIVG